MPASLELVKIALQAYASGDSEIALALSGPHIRWDERASRPDGDLIWGQDKVARAMRRYIDSWEEYRFDLEEIAEVGPGRVVGICRERGKPKDGSAVDRRFGGLWLVEDGKVTSWTTYLTPRDAVRAAKELRGVQRQPRQVKRRAAPAAAPAPPPAQPEAESPAPAEPEAVSPPAAEPVVAEPLEPTVPERPRKRILTKSEEQKRAARARANLRMRNSRQSA